ERLRLFRRPCTPNRRTSANHAAACLTARFFQGPLCSRTAGTCGGPECNHNRKRERVAALVTAITPKSYARRLGSHNPTLCDKSTTARLFNIFLAQSRHGLCAAKCLHWGVKRSLTSYFAQPLAEEPAVKVAVDTSEIR